MIAPTLNTTDTTDRISLVVVAVIFVCIWGLGVQPFAKEIPAPPPPPCARYETYTTITPMLVGKVTMMVPQTHKRCVEYGK